MPIPSLIVPPFVGPEYDARIVAHNRVLTIGNTIAAASQPIPRLSGTKFGLLILAGMTWTLAPWPNTLVNSLTIPGTTPVALGATRSLAEEGLYQEAWTKVYGFPLAGMRTASFSATLNGNQNGGVMGVLLAVEILSKNPTLNFATEETLVNATVHTGANKSIVDFGLAVAVNHRFFGENAIISSMNPTENPGIFDALGYKRLGISGANAAIEVDAKFISDRDSTFTPSAPHNFSRVSSLLTLGWTR